MFGKSLVFMKEKYWIFFNHHMSMLSYSWALIKSPGFKNIAG